MAVIVLNNMQDFCFSSVSTSVMQYMSQFGTEQQLQSNSTAHNPCELVEYRNYIHWNILEYCISFIIANEKQQLRGSKII